MLHHVDKLSTEKSKSVNISNIRSFPAAGSCGDGNQLCSARLRIPGVLKEGKLSDKLLNSQLDEMLCGVLSERRE